jgi:hypothetical protein
MANQTRLCKHVFTYGKCCEAPALRGSEYCYWHHGSARRARQREVIAGPVAANANTGITIPLLEDGNSIQVSIQEVIHALLDQRIDHKRASLVLYALQIAQSNRMGLRIAPYASDRRLVGLPRGEEIPELPSERQRASRP